MAVITNFEILLPGGRSYNEQGIAPDLPVKLQTISFPEYKELSAVGTDALGRGSRSQCVLGLEQRLAVLGYFAGTPDEYFDDATLAAVNEYQEYRGLQVHTAADQTTLNALDEVFVTYSGKTVTFDRQLEAALEYLRPASHRPLGVKGAAAE